MRAISRFSEYRHFWVNSSFNLRNITNVFRLIHYVSSTSFSLRHRIPLHLSIISTNYRSFSSRHPSRINSPSVFPQRSLFPNPKSGATPLGRRSRGRRRRKRRSKAKAGPPDAGLWKAKEAQDGAVRDLGRAHPRERLIRVKRGCARRSAGSAIHQRQDAEARRGRTMVWRSVCSGLSRWDAG